MRDVVSHLGHGSRCKCVVKVHVAMRIGFIILGGIIIGSESSYNAIQYQCIVFPRIHTSYHLCIKFYSFPFIFFTRTNLLKCMDLENVYKHYT